MHVSRPLCPSNMILIASGERKLYTGTPERGAQGGASPPLPFSKVGRRAKVPLDKNSNQKI